ncbi:MAG: TorF family putative porin [Pseudomonadota bacterium]|uniref:TorF family putative porin n=1 Tax=Alcanivorax sp. TaxID=1872427 RepID=UPI00243A8D5A|nr:TorF family putative porin [Alcanivorax sp.]MEE3319757.1 TorF family putative porin [Pseudomonadota bacterium]
MKNVFGLKKTVIASAVAAASVMAPAIAAAEVSGSLGIASMYLWRGQDVSAGTANVSGSLDFTTEMGFYAGSWVSSAGTSVNAAGTTSTETDFYAGFGGEAGGLSYDISYWTYVYPEDDVGAGELAELIASVGMAGFTFTGYVSANDLSDSDEENFGDDLYFTLGYSYDAFGVTVGTWELDADDSNYTHVDLSYSPVENLTFTVSKVVDSDEFAPVTDDQDPLFVVGYSFDI